MKSIVLLALLLVACANQPVQQVQTNYIQACSAYGAALNTMADLRAQHKLSAATVNQITAVDNQITPICSGSLPADPAAATTQIINATAQLAAFEAATKGK